MTSSPARSPARSRRRRFYSTRGPPASWPAGGLTAAAYADTATGADALAALDAVSRTSRRRGSRRTRSSAAPRSGSRWCRRRRAQRRQDLAVAAPRWSVVGRAGWGATGSDGPMRRRFAVFVRGGARCRRPLPQVSICAICDLFYPLFAAFSGGQCRSGSQRGEKGRKISAKP
jgi:hypothetical protein